MALEFGVHIDPGDILNLTTFEKHLNNLGVGMGSVIKHSQTLDHELGVISERLEVLARDIAGVPDNSIYKIKVDFDEKSASYVLQQLERVAQDKVIKLNMKPDTQNLANTIASGSIGRLTSLPSGMFTVTSQLESRIKGISQNIAKMYDGMSITVSDVVRTVDDVIANGLRNFSTYNSEQQQIAMEAVRLANIQENAVNKVNKALDKELQRTVRQFSATAVERDLKTALQGMMPRGISKEEEDKKLREIATVATSVGNSIRRGTAEVSDFRTALHALTTGTAPIVAISDATARMIERFDRAKARVEATTSTQKKSTKEMQQRVRDADSGTLTRFFRSKFTGMLPADLSPEERSSRGLQINQYVDSLVSSFRRGKMSIKEVIDVWRSFTRGTPLTNLTGPMERFLRLLEKTTAATTKMSSATKEANKKAAQYLRDRTTTGAIGVTEGAFTKSINPKLSADQQQKVLDKIRRSMASLTSDLRSGKITAKSYYDTLGLVLSGGKLSGTTSKEIKKLYDNLVTLKNLTKNGTGDKGIGGIMDWIITPAGLTRLGMIQAAHRAIGAMISQITKHFDAAIEFERTVTRIMTITDNLKVKKDWSKDLLGISSRTGVSSVDTAKAAYELYSNNLVKGNEGLPMLEKALTFSQISGASATESISLLTYTINAFKMETADADRILALYFKTIDVGNVKAADLSTSIGTIAPLAKQAGLGLTEVAAALASLTNQGLSTEQSSTLLRNVIKEMISPTKELKSLFQEWGVQTGEQALKVFGLAGVLDKFNKEMATKGTERISELVDDLRSLQAIPALAGDKNLENFNKTIQQLRQGAESYVEAQKIMEQSNALNLDKLTAGMSNTAITIVNKFLESLSGLQTSRSFEIFRESINSIGNALAVLGEVIIATFQTLDDAFVTAEKLIGKDNVKQFLDLLPATIEMTLVAPLKGVIYSLEKIKELMIWITNNKAEDNNKAAFDKAKTDKAAIEKEMDDLRKKFSGVIEERGKVTSKILDRLKSISGIDKDTIEKLMDKQKENMDKLKEKSIEVTEEIRNNFAERLLSKKLQGDTIFERLQRARPVIVDLANESQKFFEGRNLDEARKKFESIQRIVEGINDSLKGSIDDSIKRIRDITVKAEEEKFQDALRKKTPNQKTNMVRARVNELIQQAFNTGDIDEARKLLENAENLAKEAHSSKKKSTADALVAQVRQAQIQREQQNIAFSKQAMISETEIANMRLQLETNITNQADEINNRLQNELKTHEAILNINKQEIDAFTKKLELLEKQAAVMEKIILNAGKGAPPPPAEPTAEQRVRNAVINTGRQGVGRAIGGLGVDNQLTRVSSNEMIMNPRASRQWTATLTAINAGLAPRNMNSNVSVGDININYSGTNSTETDIRKIAEGIRREIRRGTVRLT